MPIDSKVSVKVEFVAERDGFAIFLILDPKTNKWLVVVR